MGVTAPVRMTVEDAHPSRAYQSPSLLVDPHNPSTVVAGGIDMSTSTCHLFRSRDAGSSWTKLDESPSPDEQPLCFEGAIYGYLNETPLAWGSDGGLLYWALTGLNPQRDPAADVRVLVSRSTDLGDTWTSAVVDEGLPAGEYDRRSRPVTALAVDDESGTEDIVYVGWETYPSGAPRTPKVAVSIDGGETFSQARRPFDDETSERFGGSGGLQGLPPQLAVSDDGTLYVLFPGQAGGDEGVDEVPNRLLLARSDDRGETFTVTEVAQVLDANVGPSFVWSPHGGEDGTLHIVYEDRREQPLGDRDIYYQRSTDGGETFSEPEKLNDDDPSQLYSQVNPNISLAPDGRVDVAWWDWRDGAALYGNDVYHTYSSDNGDSWARNARVTDQSIDRRIGYWGNNADMRSRPGIASTNEIAVLAWSDTRFAVAAGQSQDISAASVQLEPLPASYQSKVLPYLTAVLGGLLVSGLGLFAGALLLRRRSGRDRAPAL